MFSKENKKNSNNKLQIKGLIEENKFRKQIHQQYQNLKEIKFSDNKQTITNGR